MSVGGLTRPVCPFSISLLSIVICNALGMGTISREVWYALFQQVEQRSQEAQQKKRFKANLGKMGKPRG